MNFVFYVYCNIVATHTYDVTLVSHSYDLFQLVLLVKTTYTIVNMIQVINKEARAT